MSSHQDQVTLDTSIMRGAIDSFVQDVSKNIDFPESADEILTRAFNEHPHDPLMLYGNIDTDQKCAL